MVDRGMGCGGAVVCRGGVVGSGGAVVRRGGMVGSRGGTVVSWGSVGGGSVMVSGRLTENLVLVPSDVCLLSTMILLTGKSISSF